MNENIDQGDEGQPKAGQEGQIRPPDDELSPSFLHQNQSENLSALTEPASSPVGSQTSQSTSSKRSDRRIVELLQNNNDTNDNSQRDDNWMIGEQFYQEDVAADDDSEIMSDDEEGNHDQRVVPLSDADSTDDDDDGANMGFELAPNEDDQLGESSSSEDDGDDNAAENAIDYDISIPIEHRYLGENLEESRGRQVLVSNSVSKLPLFDIRHIVLLPGQVQPITTGLMSNPRDNPFGTTAEIRNYASSDDEQIKIILEGRQRFKLLSPPFETTVKGSVVILPEVSLGRPYPDVPSRRRFLSKDDVPLKFIVSKHPKWLLRSHEARFVMKRIANHIKDWCGEGAMRDPNDFSYWVASNLPISNFERMKVLKFDCTEARLLWLLDLLEKNEYLGCSACRNVICHRKDVFLMSCSGPQNSFVNSSGYFHDTLTVSKANGLVYQSQWSVEFTWFPGYSWRIACCDHCSRHIGWCYKTQSDTKPKKFWGLSRASVRLQSNNFVEEDGNSSQDIMEW